MVVLLIFWGTSTLFFIVVAPTYFPTKSEQEFPFFHILANTCYLFVFSIIVILTGVRWLLFWFAFPWRSIMLNIFSYTCWPCLLWKNIYSVLSSFVNQTIFFFFAIEFYEFFIYLRHNSLRYVIANISPHSDIHPFILLMTTFALQKFI